MFACCQPSLFEVLQESCLWSWNDIIVDFEKGTHGVSMFPEAPSSNYRHCEAALFLGSLASMSLQGCGGDDDDHDHEGHGHSHEENTTSTMTSTMTTTMQWRKLLWFWQALFTTWHPAVKFQSCFLVLVILFVHFCEQHNQRCLVMFLSKNQWVEHTGVV